MEPTSSSTKPFPLNPLLVIVSTLSTLVASFFIYQNYVLNQKLQSLIAAESVTTKTTPTPSIANPPLAEDLTTNWKKYVNSKYGFSVNYPQSFSVTEDVKAENYYDKVVTLTGPKEFINFPMTITTLTDIDIYATSTAESIAGRESNDSGVDHTVSSKTINQYQSAEVRFAGNPETIDIYIKHPNKNIIAKLSLNLALKDNEDLLNQILSTFRFTN